MADGDEFNGPSAYTPEQVEERIIAAAKIIYERMSMQSASEGGVKFVRWDYAPENSRLAILQSAREFLTPLFEAGLCIMQFDAAYDIGYNAWSSGVCDGRDWVNTAPRNVNMVQGAANDWKFKL